MELLEILKKVKEKYLINVEYKGDDGLCFISYELSNNGIITNSEEKLFDKYLAKDRKSKGQKIFYETNGSKTRLNSRFVWKPKDYESRLNWLDKHIKINS
jgi:hypothetical protein